MGLFGVATPAFAQPEAEDATEVETTYAKLVADAVTAFDAGKYRESRDLLAQAHELRPNARTLRGMGLAAFEEGRYSLAVLDLDAALAETRQPMSESQRGEVEQLRSEANALTARYTVSGLPPDNELRVDGEEPVWDPNGWLMIDQGAHTVTLTSSTGDIRSWSVRAQGGNTSDFDLSPPPPAAVVAAEAPAAPPVELAVVPPASERTPTGISNVWAYAGFAGAAVTGSLAIWQWGERESEVEAWNSDECLRRRRTRRANCGEHEDAYQRAEAWAWVTGGLTVALSAGAVTLLLLNQRGEEHRPGTARPICVPGPVAFACRVSF
jgi:hypothetical protein